MREPAFWQRPQSRKSRLLQPLATLYGAIAARRLGRSGLRAGVPVVCVGNYHLGGAGKTPTVLALSRILRELGETPVVLSRGYGGTRRGPVVVDPSVHTAAEVGDEPVMLAAHVPVVVARRRRDGVAPARSRHASVILMDDGFQSPALKKDAALIVVDSVRGIGNGCVFPAGPLRAPLPAQLARTDALILIGEGHAGRELAAAVAASGKPVLAAAFRPDPAVVARLQGHRVLAFAGIGDPERFFATLRASRIEVAQEQAFPDHHPFSAREIERLVARAKRESLTLVTTEKDLVRLNGEARLSSFVQLIVPFPVTLHFAEAARVRALLCHRLRKSRALMPPS